MLTPVNNDADNTEDTDNYNRKIGIAHLGACAKNTNYKYDMLFD